MRIRTSVLAFLAVFAFSAVAASTASAKRVWTVNGVTLPTGTTKSLTVIKNSPATLKAGTEEIECKTIKLKTGNTIENVLVEGKGPTGRDTGTTEFSECKNVKKAGCVVTVPILVNSPTSLVENTAGTKIYDLFRPEGRTELKPAEVTAKGEPASKEAEEKLSKYTTIKQTGAGCVAATTVEGDGVAAEIKPTEGEEVKHKFVFPCPPISPVNMWNGVKEVSLKLKAFGVKAEECISEIEVELTTKEKFGVK